MSTVCPECGNTLNVSVNGTVLFCSCGYFEQVEVGVLMV